MLSLFVIATVMMVQSISTGATLVADGARPAAGPGVFCLNVPDQVVALLRGVTTVGARVLSVVQSGHLCTNGSHHVLFKYNRQNYRTNRTFSLFHTSRWL